MEIAIIVIIFIVAAALILGVQGRSKSHVPLRAGDTGKNMKPRDVAGLVMPLSKPAILIKTTTDKTLSHFGGLPPHFPGFEWPHRNSRPMGFLACIHLADLPDAFDWLPESGRLLFFYDVDEQPWGFDPEDRGGWEVIYSEIPVSSEEPTAETPSDLKTEFILNPRGMKFEVTRIPPSWEEEILSPLNLSDDEEDQLMDLISAIYGDEPCHQIGGYPNPIQSPNMALECQLASNGLYCGNSGGYNDPRAKELEVGASDWQLLLQMDSDDDLDIMRGDVGTIYFWIREQDAKRKDFSKSWLVLQCH